MNPRPFHSSVPYSCHTATIVAMIFMLIAPVAQCQYFKPFTATSKKLFAQDAIPTPGYSMAFDSAKVQEGDSLYFHFGALNDTSTYVDPICTGWGSPFCYQTNVPVWSGSLFRTDNAGTYWFRTREGDTLFFKLNAPVGQSEIFYEDQVQRFAIEKNPQDTMTILGHLDSVFTYTISHTDLGNVPIPSALDQEQIVVGKDIGLVRFFLVNEFPDVLCPVELIGNEGPDLGLHRITEATVYDFQPGDIVQTRSYSGNVLPMGQPFNFFKKTILSRADTPDSVSYEIAWEQFNITSDTVTTGTSVQQYSKQQVLADLPFERFNGAYNTLTLSATTSCPLALWRLFRDDQPSLGACEFGDCWTATDTQGPPPTSYGSLLLGVGSTSYYYEEPVYPWDPYYFDVRDIVYYKKNGVECGAEVHVGIGEHVQGPLVVISPNPSNGWININASAIITSVEVLDGRGSLIQQIQSASDHIGLDLSTIPPGIYCTRTTLQDGARYEHRIVIVR